MVNDIIEKYLVQYYYLVEYYIQAYGDLPIETIESDYQYCFYLATQQYHPDDNRFKEYLIILLDSQIKQSYIEDCKWR